jgi:two-component system sensor histidine kinase KdpD
MPNLEAEPRDGRPSPEAFLAEAARETRGRFKLFIGAAPGVGKTYEMLRVGKAKLAEGIDAVIGVVETHGRAETAAMVGAFETVPRRKLLYKGRETDEMDLDAILKRRPDLVLVDELAHTNAEGSRHPKRYLDVQELLAAGIDVYSTMNVQHLESLNDVVAKITRIRVRETVPDNILELADEIEVVDLTPEALVERLEEGKVYVRDQAQRALKHYFSIGNLTALRELALRRTADRVDAQMVDYLRAQAIEGPWDTSDHILVCVGVDAQAEAVVRAGARLATRLNASWVAIHIERANVETTDPAALKRVDDACQLAERLGATVLRVVGSDLVAEVLRYARRENVTQIVVGRSPGNRWFSFARRFTAEIVRRSVDIPVHVVNAPEVRAASPKAGAWHWPKPDRFAREAGGAVGAVAVAVGLSAALSAGVRLPNLSMIFLLAVLFCAAQFGLWSAIGASFLSFLAYNYFFIEPYYTFSVAEPQELLALIIFLIVSVLTGSLAARLRDQSQSVRRRALNTQLLYDFSRKLSGAAKRDEVLWASSTYLQKAQGGHIVFLMPEDGDLVVGVSWPPDTDLSAGEMSAARWALQKREPAGWRTNTLPTMRFQFRPLVSPRGVVAVCGFEPRDKDQPISAEDERALTAILEQTAIAIDRSLLIGEAVRAAALEDNERLRTTLLASLSHDLRTPLSSITGRICSPP